MQKLIGFLVFFVGCIGGFASFFALFLSSDFGNAAVCFLLSVLLVAISGMHELLMQLVEPSQNDDDD